MEKYKILIELEKKDNTTENFKFGFSRIFEKCGYKYKFVWLNEIIENHLNWCDIYIAVRPNTPISLSIAKVIKKSGKKYLTFFDDDLINRKESIRWRNDCSKKCVEIADAVFGYNPDLCQRYAGKSKYYFCLNTAVDESEIVLPCSDNSKIQFVYAAGRDHAHIFEKIIKPSIRILLKDYHDKIHFTFIGVKPYLSDLGCSECFTYVELMPLKEYTEFMRTHHFDIGLSPLFNDKFSQMKYFNKYFEYGKYGIPGIYSKVKPYTFAIKNGYNGVLVNNSCKEWYRCLKSCIENIENMKRIGLTAQYDLKKNYSLGSISNEFQEHFRKILEMDAGSRCITFHKIRWRKKLLIKKIFRFVDVSKKLALLLREKGIIEICKFIIDRF